MVSDSEIVAIAATFIAGILGISYPLVATIVSRIEDQYRSSPIVNLFYREPSYKFFKFSLGISVLSIGIWCCEIPPLFETDNILIIKSGLLLVGISTVITILFFFILIERMLTYISFEKLTKLVDRYYRGDFEFLHKILTIIIALRNRFSQAKRVAETNLQTDYLQCFDDLLTFSIRSNNRKVCLTLTEYFSTYCNKERQATLGTDEIQYPYQYYEIHYNALVEYTAGGRTRKLFFLESALGSADWFRGSFDAPTFSPQTYVWLWRYMVVGVEEKNDNIIRSFLESNSQYIDFQLGIVEPEYNVELEISNQAAIEKREGQRKKFFEFHIALGGLLLNQKRLDCLNALFNYTQSYPPSYPLLPVDVNEIFKWYDCFNDPYHVNFRWITTEYYFPQLSGMNAERQVKDGICYYIVFLFVVGYYRPDSTLPIVPSNRRTCNDYIEFIPKLITQIEKLFLDRELVTHFQLSEKSNDNGAEIVTYMNRYKEILQEYMQDSLEQQGIDPGKKEKFLRSTQEIVEKALQEIPFSRVEAKNDLRMQSMVGGITAIIDKSIFAENQEVGFLDGDSLVARNFVPKIAVAILTFLDSKCHQSFNLIPEDFLAGLKKLYKDDMNIIVCYGNPRLKELLEQSGIKSDNISYYPHARYKLGGECVYLVPKTQTPIIYFAKNDSEEDKFKPELLNTQYQLYASLTDLNEAEPLRKEYVGSNDNEAHLKTKVIAGIHVNVQVNHNQDLQLIRLTMSSPYDPAKIINSISEVG